MVAGSPALPAWSGRHRLVLQLQSSMFCNLYEGVSTEAALVQRVRAHISGITHHSTRIRRRW